MRTPCEGMGQWGVPPQWPRLSVSLMPVGQGLTSSLRRAEGCPPPGEGGGPTPHWPSMVSAGHLLGVPCPGPVTVGNRLFSDAACACWWVGWGLLQRPVWSRGEAWRKTKKPQPWTPPVPRSLVVSAPLCACWLCGRFDAARTGALPRGSQVGMRLGIMAQLFTRPAVHT